MNGDALVKKTTKIMFGDAGISGTAQYMSQLVWILFLKVFDYKEEEWELELALGFPDGSSKTIPERFRIQGIVWGKDTILVTKNADGSYSAVR